VFEYTRAFLICYLRRRKHCWINSIKFHRLEIVELQKPLIVFVTGCGARKNSESFPTRRLALGESLETLFSLECIVVTAYLEAVTPIFYCCYVLVMVHLPSSQYHMELTGITSHNAGSKVQSLFVFGLFQIASFVVLALVIKRNCGIHALQQLAFVIETQTSLVQGKLLGWMVITLCFRVVHFGTKRLELFRFISD
ncbi:hypothetical protein JG688_00012750, partial [Phytophthora aleatoria]